MESFKSNFPFSEMLTSQKEGLVSPATKFMKVAIMCK